VTSLLTTGDFRVLWKASWTGRKRGYRDNAPPREVRDAAPVWLKESHRAQLLCFVHHVGRLFERSSTSQAAGAGAFLPLGSGFGLAPAFAVTVPKILPLAASVKISTASCSVVA
jgi:hypothetical protein